MAEDLLRKAKKSRNLRRKLGEWLLAPENWPPEIPKLPDRELLAALRLTDAGAGFWPPDSSQEQAWLAFRNECVRLLRLQCFAQPSSYPLTHAKNLRAANHVLQVVSSHPLERFQVNVDFMQSELKRMEKAAPVLPKGYSSHNNHRPIQRGRRFTEQSQLRTVAELELLKECGERDPYNAMKDMLGNRCKRAADLKRLVHGYNSAHDSHRWDAFLLPRNLLMIFLEEYLLATASSDQHEANKLAERRKMALLHSQLL